MAPEIEAYRDAVSGRALNLKCRGGQTAHVEVSGYWSFNWVDASGGSFTWDETSMYALSAAGSFDTPAILPNLSSVFQAPGPLAFLIGSADRNGKAINGPGTFQDRTVWNLQAVNAQGERTGFIQFRVDGFRSVLSSSGINRIQIFNNPLVRMAPTYGDTNTATNADEIRLSPPAADTGSTTPTPTPGFDFWARLDAGAGSILESDGTEVQTVDLVCRYDPRHTIGDYIGVPDDDDYNYIITELDYIGRQKWQTLTCKRLRRVR